MDNKLYKLMNWPEIEGVVYSDTDHPENVLGCHEVSNGYLIQCFFPGASVVYYRNLVNGDEIPMECADEEGFFACLVSGKNSKYYEYVVVYDDREEVRPEVYGFIPKFWGTLTEKLSKGELVDSYKYLGAHFCERKGILGTEFFVYAPKALRVSVVGDFNNWDGRVNQMIRVNDEGIFGLFIPNVSIGSLYKFEIKIKGGLTYLKRDPYAFKIEAGEGDASVVLKEPEWEYFHYKRSECENNPFILSLDVNDYVSKYGYDALVDDCLASIDKYSYDSVLLEDLSVYTNKSVCRKGVISPYLVNTENITFKNIKEFIDKLHAAGIRVFMKFDMSSMISDNCGLKGFDGTKLFEKDDFLIDNRLTYDYDKPFVRNYLMSACNFKIVTFDLDGLCIGGIDRILYLDYGRENSGCAKNIYGGNECVSAYSFLKELTAFLHESFRNLTIIAADSFESETLTASVSENGMGFDYKIHSSFDADLYDYFSEDPLFRGDIHSQIVFLPDKLFSERFILAFSDAYGETDVNLKNRMYGSNDDFKLDNLRCLVAFSMLMPCVKCFPFVKSESLMFDTFYTELIKFKAEHEALSLNDFNLKSFEWINTLDADNKVFAFKRRCKSEALIVICNFSNSISDYDFLVEKGVYKEIFSTALKRFGGQKKLTGKPVLTKPSKSSSANEALHLRMAPLSVNVFEKSTCQTEG